MTSVSLNHALDLGPNVGPALDLFAEEVSTAEQLHMCCVECLGTYSTVYTWGGSCASTFSCASTYSCDCS